ncbi:Fpg/Nei family DNA glycosylase [Yinghuangia seranimata]|uniref:Fpg/Nei family DNA glycosylase n=1 Tax=Yinghuangia seranimata TaxID=408067 RepID=UPI00248D293B|nr:DNA-formamidopyrimidine glycosylase family protein [Yinghuangia seranimata]MDI2132388.1 DNA-formamidopyrimidine glycosylase family protein [Yinghuangia seranimata]
MPEGDTVYQTAARLRGALAGRALTRTDFRVPRYATVDLRGREVLESLSRGKHLLLRMTGNLTLHTHLRMDGAWRIQPAHARVPHSGRDAVRVVLWNDAYAAVGMRLPVVDLLPTGEESRVVGHLGPDPLGPDWDVDEAARRLARQPARPIGEALLDQRNLAGIGNVYRAELCFLRGVSPFAPVERAGDLHAMADLARRALDANRDRPGHVTTGDPRPGRQNWVYGRAGRPCLRCGTQVRRVEAGDPPRVVFWCPKCQPEDAASA